MSELSKTNIVTFLWNTKAKPEIFAEIPKNPLYGAVKLSVENNMYRTPN